MPTATVVICTYNRPQQLRRAVASVRAQFVPADWRADIVVVDNSRDANARPALPELLAGPGLAVTYVSLPEPNISLARNAGIAAAAGEWIIFLDDDQWAEPDWLSAYLATAATAGADMLFGPVLADFPAAPPEWNPTGNLFERNFAAASGTIMPFRADARSSGRWLSTGNSMLRRATCLADPAPFDARLGRAGGEDYDLFLRLVEQGRRMAWCAEAVAHDIVPEDRTTFEYMVYRLRRSAQQWAWIVIHRNRRPVAMAARVLVRAAAQVILALGAGALRQLRGAGDRRQTQLTVAQGLGKLLWWRLPKHYR